MATTLRVADLDFDQIKTNLKEFLRTKPEFTDYDYEGSALSVLMDLLAYNTHYNAVIANMLLQELYLDTAVKKQSLGLIAKRLGYLPKGFTAPRAKVTLEVFPYDAPSTLTLGKNAKFSARIGTNTNAIFVTRDAVTINRSTDGRYVFENLEIYEGDNAVFRYQVTNPAAQSFEIPSRFVDLSLVRVYIQSSLNSTDIEEWINFNSIIDLKSDTKAYFIKLNENQNYEVYFGDDVLGKSVVEGNIVIIDYVTTNGTVANSASNFTFADSVAGYTNVTVTTVSAAFGGALPESNDSIRRNAQNNVLLQNRAVTETDYAAIVSQIVPLDTIAVYGGETLTPAQYGKVIISVKQLGTTSPLLQTQKNTIIAELKKRSMMSVIHEFVDPEYTYLHISTEVKYDPRRTTLSDSSLKAFILSKIKDYGSETLNKFNSSFEYSNLVGFIDDIDRSILSNDTSISLRKEKNFVYNTNSIYEFDFNSPIKPSNSREQNIISSMFMSADYPGIELYLDDMNGSLRFYQIVNSNKQIVAENMGTVNYETGMIRLNLTAVLGTLTKLSIEVVPNNKNILPSRNSIITLDEADIEINMTAA